MKRISCALRTPAVVAVLMVACAVGTTALAKTDGRTQAPVVPSWLEQSGDLAVAGLAGGTPLDTLKVTDFGAIGDGVADDVVAIQTALNTANAGGGGTVLLPRGVYSVSATVWMRSNVVLRGMGEDSVIVADGNYVALAYSGTAESTITDTIVRDLTIRGSGNPSHNGNTLISMNRHVERAWVDQVWLDQAGYDAWHALMDCRQIYVTRCRITGAGDDGLNPGGTGGGDEHSSRDIVLSQNHISGAAHDGIHISFNSNGVQATGNTIVDSGVGIGIFHSFYSTIKDNVIRNCGTGIRNHAPGSHHIVVSGNLIDSPMTGPGIDFGFEHEQVELTGNTILFPAGGSAHGIHEIDGHYGTIRDNIIQGASDGIRITSGVGTVVSRNIVTQSQSGVVFDASDGMVSGNNIDDVAEYGIMLPGGSGQARNVVASNIVRNTAMGGIYVASNATAITGNHALDVSGLSIEDVGAGNTVVNNYVETVSVAPTTRVIHLDIKGRAGFGKVDPQYAIDVDGDVSADALRIKGDRYRIFAGPDGLYIEDRIAGTTGRILLGTVPAATVNGREDPLPREFVDVDRGPTTEDRP